MSEPRRRRRPQMLEIEQQLQQELKEEQAQPENSEEYSEEPQKDRRIQPMRGEAPVQFQYPEREEKTGQHKQTAKTRLPEWKAKTEQHKQAVMTRLPEWKAKLGQLKQAVKTKLPEWKAKLEQLKRAAQAELHKWKVKIEQHKQAAKTGEADQAEIDLTGANLHGAAARRKRQEQIRRERVYFALFALFALIAVISLTMIVKTVVRSIRTHVTNRELAQRREELLAEETQSPELLVFAPQESQAAQETDSPQATEVPQATPEPQATATPAKKDVVRSTQYHVASGTPLSHMEALYEENRDLIGWITMDEILDLPVMYRDNSYYLKRDFYKNKNESGTLFLDVNHRFNEWTQNLLLHGHNMKDGTMFGRLTQYLQDISYLKNNPFVHYDTLWRREEYVIFAVLRVSLDVKDEAFFNYFSYPTFASDAAFNAYIRELQLRSEYAIPIDVAPGDALLTLSTCLDEDRLVIVCRRIREGETRSQLRESIRLAVRQ